MTVAVSEEDKGIVIGRKGRTINAIRDLITINAIRNDRRVKVVIKDDGRKEEEGESRHNDVDDVLLDEEI